MKKLKLTIMILMLVMAVTGCASEKHPDKLKVGSLKGPTSMGIVNMMFDDSLGKLSSATDFKIAAMADELSTAIVKGELDIALVPANIASVLYNKTNGGVVALDINTLGVLYVLDRTGSISSVKDLKGKTLYMTGKGTTPDLVLHYLLSAYGVDANDVDIHYCSEASEVIAELDNVSAALLPEPFVTTASTKDDSLKVCLDLTKLWDDLDNGSTMVTGVTIARTEFVKEYPDAVKTFLSAHEKSVEAGKNDLDKTAERIEEKGIVNAAIAKKAYERCHITCIKGEEMKTSLSGYLKAIADLDASSIGGKLPGDDFYYSST